MKPAIYMRVSTDRQTVEHQRSQVEALVSAVLAASGNAGLRAVAVEEVESGAKARPKLRALVAGLRAGDVLAVWALDRLGRNALEQVNLIRALLDRGVRILSVQEPWIDVPGPVRELLVFVFAWVAQQERARLVERTRAGVATARARGKRLGRPPADPATLDRMRLLVEGGASWGRAAQLCGVSRSTAKRLRKAAGERAP